jgi:hypothetical protein
MKTKLTLFVTVLASALFLGGCASVEMPPFVNEGLVAYYPFNRNAEDATNNGNDAIDITATPTQDRKGIEGKAYSFDRQIISVRHHESLGLKDSMTISLWIKPGKTVQWQRILAKANPKPDAGYGLAMGEANDEIVFYIGSNKLGKSTDGLKNGQWQHVVAVREQKDGYKIYLDGTSMPLRERTDMNNRSGSNLTIGGHRKDDRTFDGSIDDIRIYNRALSGEEVKSLYDFEKP